MTSTSTRASTTTTSTTSTATAAAAVAASEPIHVVILQYIKKRLAKIQAYLEFTSFQGYKAANNHNDDEHDEQELEYPQFATKYGLGRVALLACILGIIWGIHFVGALHLTIYHFKLILFSSRRDDEEDIVVTVVVVDNKDINKDNDNTILDVSLQFLYFYIWQWCIYIVTVCTFHLLEFFITSLYNPTTCSADSFLINHSISYTAAVISSWLEFFTTRIFLLILITLQNNGIIQMSRILHAAVNVWISWNYWSFVIGIMIVIIGQVIRTMAMITAGESFNHLIQTRRKPNHILITHGIYSILRHPSYVGFYYWSVGEQLILSNIFNSVALAIVACLFFRRRIPYEEESLAKLFPNEYPLYVARTYMGIPFIPKSVVVETAANNVTTKKNDDDNTTTAVVSAGEKED